MNDGLLPKGKSKSRRYAVVRDTCLLSKIYTENSPYISIPNQLCPCHKPNFPSNMCLQPSLTYIKCIWGGLSPYPTGFYLINMWVKHMSTYEFSTFSYDILIWSLCVHAVGRRHTAECIANAIADNHFDLVILVFTIDLHMLLLSKDCPTCDGTVMFFYLVCA